MFQVTNQTPFATALHVQPDAEGIDALHLAVRACFEIGPDRVRVAEEQPPVVPGDTYAGDPTKSGLVDGGQSHPPKPATDVIMTGSAHAPGGRPLPYFGVSLSVGRFKKVAHVFGDRVWRAGAFTASASPPIPVASVPMVWERSFGGRHELAGGKFLAEMRNPAGVGFRGKRSTPEMNGRPLPNFEDPRHPIQSLSDQPVPFGFGCVAPWWLPRSAHAGTYDDAWRTRRAPFLPTDFDPRFWQQAPADQILPGRLQGGEPVEMINASPTGVQRFQLPTCRFDAAVTFRQRVEPVPLVLDTLLLEPDRERFSLLWHGAVRCDKDALKIEGVSLVLDLMEGVAG